MSKEPIRRLGRGLNALISSTLGHSPAPQVEDPAASGDPESIPEPPVAATIQQINLALIDPNPQQPRREFDPVRLQALANSLSTTGALQPIVVRQAGDRFMLVAGERRLRAARLAGLTRLPAIIRQAADDQLLELALIENIQREDLNAVDRARAYLALTRLYALTPDELAKRLGEDRSTVSNYIRILDLDDDILQLVATEQLSMGHARALLALGRPDNRLRLARRTIEEGWSVRDIENEIRTIRTGSKTPAPANPDAATKRPLIADLEQRLSAAIGMRVTIHEGRGHERGRVVIRYSDLDQFARLARAFGVDTDAM